MKKKIFLLIALILVAFLVWTISAKQSNKIGIEAYEHTKEILAFGPRPPGSETLAKVRAYHAEKLKAAGWITREQVLERYTPKGTLKFVNLIARFSNKRSESDVWNANVKGLLCAHIDSKFDKDGLFVGADDAASACAGILTLAKELGREHPQFAEQMELVFFDGEEAVEQHLTPSDGLYGSNFYATSLYDYKEKPKFGILLDMIGHKNLSIAIPPDSPVPLKDKLFEIAKKQNVENHFKTASGSIIDDHYHLNKVGVPTIDIIGDFANSTWWHKPADNLSIISAESLSISLNVILELLLDQLK